MSEMNRESVKQAILGLFAERRPGWPPDDSILKAWTDHLMGMEGMTEEKIWNGCVFLGEQEGDFHLGSLLSAIRRESERRLREERDQEQKREWEEGRRQAMRKVPRAALMAIQMWKEKGDEAFEEMVERQDGLLEAMREEAKSSTGAMREEWNRAGVEYKNHCEWMRERGGKS